MGEQASKIVGADRDEVLLRSGDRARVTFEFLYRPEYLVLGARLIFREGGTKGIGKASSPAPALMGSLLVWGCAWGSGSMCGSGWVEVACCGANKGR